MWIVAERNVIVRRLHVCVWTCIYPFATVGYVIQWEVQCWAISAEWKQNRRIESVALQLNVVH